jgi:hypothetical protein
MATPSNQLKSSFCGAGPSGPAHSSSREKGGQARDDLLSVADHTRAAARTACGVAALTPLLATMYRTGRCFVPSLGCFGVQFRERERVGSDHRISSLVPAPSTPTARLANTRGGEGGHGSDLAT